MTYHLYGDIGSGSAPVEMALAEIGAPVVLHEIPLSRDAQLAPDYLRINPMGRIPTLVLPDGTVLTESLAILLTLCDRHKQAALLPEPGSAERAQALRWMAMAAGEFYPAVTRSDYPERFSTDPAHTPGIRAAARLAGQQFWRLVEQHAAPAPFLLGARFSVADLYLAVLSRWMDSAAWMPAECPRVEALAAAVAARPAAGAVWRRHFSPG